MNIALCIAYLRPNAEFSIVNNDFDTLEWRSSGDPPTIKEIEDCWPIVRDSSFINKMRAQRDLLLAASDWTQTHDDPTGNREAWATYRQALRDFPATWEPSEVADFPNPPGGE